MNKFYKPQCVQLLQRAGWTNLNVRRFEEVGWSINWDEVIAQTDGDLCGLIACTILWGLASQPHHDDSSRVIVEGYLVLALASQDIPRPLPYNGIRPLVVERLQNWLDIYKESLQICHTGTHYDFTPDYQAAAAIAAGIDPHNL